MNFSLGRMKSAALGRKGEALAREALRLDGFTLLARDWRCKAGELDIVALDGKEIVFVEVKTVRHHRGFTPAGNLSFRQRRRNLAAAKVYLRAIEKRGYAARFDLIEVTFAGRFLRSLHRTVDYLPPLPPLPEDSR